MTTTPIPGTTASLPPVGSTGSTGSATSQAQLDKTYTDFLQLLLTQLKNQDPTSPVDTTQFTQQIVALNQVQQAVTTNSNLEKLITVTQGSQINNAVSYIGKTVDATGNQGVLSNGAAQFSYSLPTAASKVTVTISDSAGNVVYSGDGSTKAGKNVVLWDGSSTTSDQTMPDGIYSVAISAQDSAGKDITPTTYTTGAVSSVNMSNGDVMLALGDGTLQVPIENVQTIRDAAVASQ